MEIDSYKVSGEYCFELDEVPDLLGLAEAFPESFPFLLDSAAIGPVGGYSLLFHAAGDVLLRQACGTVEGPGSGSSFFARLESWYQSERAACACAQPVSEGAVPFSGGWFLYLGYEMAAEIESRLQLPANATGLPDAFAARCPGAIIVFHPPPNSDPARSRALLVAENAEVKTLILQRLQSAGRPAGQKIPSLEKLQADEPEEFLSGTRRVLDYLRAGDVFQVNISRNWAGYFASAPNPVAIYRQLRRNNPAPFAGLLRWGSAAVLSSSPERLVQLRGAQVQTRPIAGTRPRGTDPALDLALARELIDNVKERAEHIMLIDLERNDLGRVCRPGTVEVNELMVIESHAHVHHIVSNVRGELMPATSPVDAIRAVFPGGTITGCPKIRCMEIIAELERVGRGFYTGSMGYLGLDGSMDLNILIRSMLLQRQDITFRTGAGIVADSDPDRELQETCDKARGLLLALEDGAQESLCA
ncbi:MAG TPA: aminodeoxychorismate synthase component I [Xanthomonadales bacterium]|nr:aminodeoxychorismate synthase component I [Xanthomonadales bacterium]